MAANLTPAMIAAITSDPNEDGERFARLATINALIKRGLATPAGGTSWFTLTEAGEAERRQELGLYVCQACGDEIAVTDQPAHNDGHKDESVNEEVDGAEVATRWLNLDPSYQTETPEQMANRLALVPSPQRDYQSSQEALAVLNRELIEADAEAEFGEGGCDEHNSAWVGGFPPVAEVPEPADTDVDPEFAAEVDALVATKLANDPIPVAAYSMRPELPITETDVQVASVYVVVQLKNRLYDGKLITVVNRRTQFCNPICATVEVGGHRFLVNADDLLAA